MNPEIMILENLLQQVCKKVSKLQSSFSWAVPYLIESSMFPDTKHFIDCLNNFKNGVVNENNNEQSTDELRKKLKVLREDYMKRQKQIQNMNDEFEMDVNFKNNIMAQNNQLIKEEKDRQTNRLECERKIFNDIIASKKRNFEKTELKDRQIKIENLQHNLEQIRLDNSGIERSKRQEWDNMKKQSQRLRIEYDEQIRNLEIDFNTIQGTYNKEIQELQHFKTLFESEEVFYRELMKEKEEYTEKIRQQRLFEIRSKIAARTIVRFIEENYSTWKMKKKKNALKKKRSKYVIRSKIPA